MSFRSGSNIPYAVEPSIQGLLAWNGDGALGASTSLTPTAATIYLAKVPIPKSITATNIVIAGNTAGNSYTNAQLGLYSSAGTFLKATAVQASAGTNGFGSTTTITIPLSATQALSGSPTTFVWVALHMGTNGVTAFVAKAFNVASSVLNAGLTVSTARFGTIAGSAANDLATIGNLTPASIAFAALPFWCAIT